MTAQPPSQARLQPLDAVRFIAALAVVLYHYLAINGVEGGWLETQAQYGFLGVDLFFVVSGFVILMSALGRRPGEFVWSRIIRIVPTFWLCCTLTFALDQWLAPPEFTHSLPTYLMNMSLAVITPVGTLLKLPLIDDAYWTLAVETLFYIFIWAGLLTRLLKSETVRPLLWAWLGVSVLLQAGTALTGSSIIKMLGEVLLFDFAGYFVAGGLFYLAYKGLRKRSDLLALFLCYALSVYGAIARAPYFDSYPALAVTPLGIGVVVALIFAVFAAFSFRRGDIPGLGVLSRLGGATYSLYLIHGVIGNLLLHGRLSGLPDSVALMVAIAVSVALSLLIHRHFEEPVARWLKNRILKRTTVSASITA